MTYHYVVDAASFLEQCLDELSDVLDASSAAGRSDYQLYDLREVLILTERLLTAYTQVLLRQSALSLGSSTTTVQQIYSYSSSSSRTNENLSCLASSIKLLREASEDEKETCVGHQNEFNDESGDLNLNSYYSKRNPTDSLLFRLIVALQLCIVRIGDARLVITGRRENESKVPGSSTHSTRLPMLIATCCVVALLAKSYDRSTRKIGSKMPLSTTIRAGLGLISVYWFKNRWANMWMTAKITKTIDEIQQWNYQWRLVQSTRRGNVEEVESLDVESKRLIDFALHETPRASFWHSQGELRFLMLKRAMDVFYASVQTATKVTGKTSDDAIDWQVVLATAAVSSFYTLTGARQLAEQATSSSESARKLIQHSWGMVSWPALKTISLQASRLLKGAAIADRLEIAGVSCFVLSREPVPELKAASTRLSRTHVHRQTLSTIDEQEEHTPTPLSLIDRKPFAGSCTRYRQRDVILHMTAGGFFTHTIASDLPYLLDWSAATGAVVLCPEYCLLPQHTFPDALHQVEAVYKVLHSEAAVHVLGFEVNRIVLTGESSGGNLATALCVKLCMDADGTPTCLSNAEKPFSNDESATENSDQNVQTTDNTSQSNVILPCAMVLSCPVLNLSLELSHSRVIGFQDPVLPNGLLTAISDAYLPRKLRISKKDPLVSPLFATDSVLSRFPPTLVFASSTDPLLDDSVAFNERLRRLGVESDLRAAQNLCHAFFGLGTAGFPEAKDVQHQLIEWLNFQLTRMAQAAGGDDNGDDDDDADSSDYQISRNHLLV